ncbi:MAG TPA: DUF711 family protein [Chloroflexia bacterium]|nr:DUF711 family protein [Chloroflexia bacterium]
MNIRSLTVGAALPQEGTARASLIGWLGSFAQAGRAALEGAGFTVQTTRLSTQPLEQWVEAGRDKRALVASVGKECIEAGIDYCSLGTVQAASGADDEVVDALLEEVPSLLLAAGNVFASVQVGVRTSLGSAINLDAVRASARIIKALSEQTAGGFGNLRFAAAANCPPHIPFFPASYYLEDERNGGNPEFGLALEAADLAVRAFNDARTHEEARGNLLALLVEEGGKAAEACAALGSEYGYTFTGLDISMAPYPEPERSIGRALEMLSGAPLGSPGTLAAAAFFTDVLKEARKHLPTVGYSGLMLPALEDQTLADRAAEGLVDLDTLLLMSAVCGLGLDTVPLPGDVTLAQLERIIFDTASLAVKLDKTLTARLLPVPGMSAGEPAEWPDFPYFAKGRVMKVAEIGEENGSLFSGKWVRYS